MISILDTHQHLWDLSKFKLAWVTEGHELAKSYVPADYARATEGLNVVKAVYMEVDVIPEQQQKEADYVVGLCESGTTPTCAAVVSGRPNSAGFEKYARQFKGHKYVKGIRQVLHVKETPPGYALEADFVKGIKLLGELGLSFDLCVRPAELPDFVKLVDQCPGTRFVLDHCGNADLKHGPAERERWKRDMAEIAKRKDRIAVLAFSRPDERVDFWIRMPREPAGYAKRLYAALRELDSAGCETILIEQPPQESQWDAVLDRLRRATG